MIISQNSDLEIFGYDGEGYERTMNYESWRVALANYAERFDKNKFERVERHLLTDEVFVLLDGSAELAMGTLSESGMEIKYVPLEKGKILWYNMILLYIYVKYGVFYEKRSYS